MYRILLFLCILETMAFDSDEAKYIDLLPEEEKQEFLNRIARRILEEIQSKDSPEESHAEVTDDQLDAHETYVQEILKEESDNLRNEKREISQKAKYEQEVAEKPSPLSVGRNSKDVNLEDGEKTHIDLTLRDGKILRTERRLNENQNLNINPDNNDASYDVIPVNVVYDKDTNKQGELTTNTSQTIDDEQSHTRLSETFDQQLNDSKRDENTSNLNEYKPKSSEEDIPRPDQSNKQSLDERDDVSTILPNTEIVDINNTNMNQDVQISKEQSTGYLNNNQETSSKVDIENEKGIDDVTSIVPIISTNIEITEKSKSLENIENSTKNIKVFNNEQSTLMPLTTELNTVLDSKNVKISEEVEETTTFKGLTMNPNTKHNDKYKISGNKEENERPKKYYRKKLKILSEDYSVEEVESFENNKRQNNNEDNAVDRYFVYEISDDKPAYIQKTVTKDYEQPYYVPIYNFAPNNAYYNAYNHLGPNANEEFDIKLDDNNDELDKDISNGFLIDLRSKGGKKTRYKYPTEKIRPDPREYISRFNPDSEETRDDYPYIDTDYFFYPKKDRRQRRLLNGDNRWGPYTADQQSLGSNIRDLPDFTMDKNIAKLIYGSRRRNAKDIKRKRHKKKKLGVRELPGSSEEDHPYYSIHKSNIKDHIRAVRKLLYKQKKFGYMPPSPYAIQTEPRYKRMMGTEGLAIRNNETLSRNVIMGQSNSNIKNIAWDYYWGRIKKTNNSYDFDDDDDKTVHLTNIRKDNRSTPKSFLPGIRSERVNTDNSYVSIDTLTDVLKDMIRRDNRYLVSYKWLETTVGVVSAIRKLLYLTESAQNGNHIHPLDLNLLKYVIDLYVSSEDRLSNDSYQKKESQNSKLAKSKANADVSKTIKCLLARTRLLPKVKRRKPGEKIRNPINLWMAFNYNRVLDEDNSPDVNDILADFKDFLTDLEDNLYELHNALKRIAFITTYKKQNWYYDLKNIFLKEAPRRRLQQLLLHLSTSKLIDSIENRMKKRNSGNIKNNKEDTRKIEEYFVLVLKVLEVMNGRKNQFRNQFLRECNIL